MQDRAKYIRQVWAEREALQVKQTATQKALQAAQTVASTPPAPQSNSPPSPPTPPPTQPNSLAKKKRNQKTRNQYKKKAQSQAQRVMVQEVEHTYDQEVDLIRIGVEKSSKYVVLQWNNVATSSHGHAVISYVGMTSFDGMIMVQNGAIGMSRMGVG